MYFTLIIKLSCVRFQFIPVRNHTGIRTRTFYLLYCHDNTKDWCSLNHWSLNPAVILHLVMSLFSLLCEPRHVRSTLVEEWDKSQSVI